MKFKVVILLLLNFSLLSSQDKPLPNDLKWMTKSVEYAALCEQVYRMAWPVVKTRAMAEKDNWAVVFDVDETVLDNSLYALERVAIDSGYTKKSWLAWERREEAKLIPGAKSFIDSVRSLGIKAHIAFISDRDFETEKYTVSNLKKAGLFKDGDIVLTKKDREDTKKERRRCVETATGRCTHYPPMVIIALFGDNIRDFMGMQGMDNAQKYRNEQLPADENWGTKYFILPNSNYGSWQRNYE